ncbi:DnaJ domain protein [Bacteroidales bacterium Barb4]|nr:DnaJ domain protein [Bacteroidales bacterium Barb4]
MKKAIPAQDNSLSAVFTVIKEIEQKSYGNAIALITDFVTRFRSLTVFVDAEIAALRLEAKVLGLQISSLEDEKADIEKLLYEFNVRHDRELGGLIMKILESRKKKLKEEAKNDSSKKEKAREAERDYKEYKQTYEDSARKVIAVLDDEQQKELKANYRKASKLCHPDVVNEKQKAQAEAVFRTLKEAYDTNDLEKVTEILANLEQGIFAAKSTEINEKKELLVTVAYLRQRRDELEQELIDLKASEIYQTVSQIEDWDAYFRQRKEWLEREWMSLAG